MYNADRIWDKIEYHTVRPIGFGEACIFETEFKNALPIIEAEVKKELLKELLTTPHSMHYLASVMLKDLEPKPPKGV